MPVEQQRFCAINRRTLSVLIFSIFAASQVLVPASQALSFL